MNLEKASEPIQTLGIMFEAFKKAENSFLIKKRDRGFTFAKYLPL